MLKHPVSLLLSILPFLFIATSHAQISDGPIDSFQAIGLWDVTPTKPYRPNIRPGANELWIGIDSPEKPVVIQAYDANGNPHRPYSGISKRIYGASSGT